MYIERVLKLHGLSYSVIRPNSPERSVLGIPNRDAKTKRAFVILAADADVKAGDVLVNSAGEKLYVIDTATEFLQKKPEQLTAFYQTEAEHLQAISSSAVLHIENAYGVNVGDGNTVIINYSDSLQALKDQVSEIKAPDRADMEKIVSLLEMIVENQVPPSKGLLSRFSGLLERHSWLSNAVASTLLGWLMSQIG